MAVSRAIQGYANGNASYYDEAINQLGYTIHTAEDFYAHSNWVETHATGVLGTFNAPSAPKPEGWYSTTSPNSGDSGPNAGSLHCPPGTPSHNILNDSVNSAIQQAAQAEARRQILLFRDELISATSNEVADSIFRDMGFLTPQATTEYRSDRTRSVRLPGGPWGTTGAARFCRPGSFVSGFSQKVEPPQGAGDDTALNSVYFYCTSRDGYIPEILSPWTGGWGTLSPWVRCPSAGSFITVGALKVEPQQGSGDDTSANAARFYCGNGTLLTANNDGPWGSWLGTAGCGAGEAVCGVQIQNEPWQGTGDDTGMNGMVLHCCKL